ncbi:MAG: alpha-galactosidase, partial [Lachnospiraceae bacterium]|nr:alpha-galactosidase [Lachnospiraceae bacterium]
MKKVYSEFILGDMKNCYVQDEETGSMELVLLPADMTYEVAYREKPYPDSLVQVKLVGDTYAGGYAGGRTMRQNASVDALVFEEQKIKEDNGETVICTVLTDARGYRYRHFLRWKEGKKSLLSHTEFENVSNEKVGPELLSSFSLGGISPFVGADEAGKLKLHRIR